MESNIIDSDVCALYDSIYSDSEAIHLFNDCMREVLREQYCDCGLQFSFLRRNEYQMILQEVESCGDCYNGLDIGCGLGSLTRLLMNQKRGRWTGIDSSAVAVIKARALNQEQSPEFFIGNAKSMPVLDCSIRCVVAADSLQNARPYSEFVDELCRIMEPKGCLLFTTWMNANVSSGSIYSDTLLSALEAAGFVISIQSMLQGGIEDQIRISMLFIERRYELIEPNKCVLLGLLAREIEYLLAIRNISKRYLIRADKR